MNYRELFMGLYKSVADLEPPDGSALDEVLETFQVEYDQAVKER